jgi:hypothetical protein
MKSKTDYINNFNFVKNNTMKKIFLVLASFLTLTLGAQTIGYDQIDIGKDDITGSDTTLYPIKRKIGDCHGNLVRFTLVIKNTNNIVDTFNIGGADNNITNDIGAQHFELIDDDDLPFIIDSTIVAPAVGGMRLCGDYYVKTLYLDNFPFQLPGVFLSKSASATGDVSIYIANIKRN